MTTSPVAQPVEPIQNSLKHEPTNSQHTLVQSIILHLLPGVALLLAYVLGAPLVQRWGFPTVFTASLGIIFVLAPMELGFLLYQGWRHNGRLTLHGVVRYHERIPVYQYFVFVPVLIVWYLIVMGVWLPFELSLADMLVWLPSWIIDPLPRDTTQVYSTTAVLTTTILRVLCTGMIAPIVEELYFRGYLLPRIEWLGWRAAVFNAVLFSFHHLWTPLLNPGRALAWLPIVWVVRRKRNIYLGIIVHLALNLIGVVVPLISSG